MTEHVDTGFDAVLAGEKWEPDPPVTATVTPPPQPDIADETSASGLTEDGKDAAKALVALPATLDAVTLAKLARDIAMDVKERHAILKDFNLTQAQYDYLEANNRFYKAALEAACTEWHAPLNTAERIKVEAAAILEDSLPGLGARMQNKGEGLPGVVEAAKLFQKLSGVGERAAGALDGSERFTINIDLGGDQKIVVSTQEAPSPPSQLDIRRALSSYPQEESLSGTIQPLPERAGDTS